MDQIIALQDVDKVGRVKIRTSKARAAMPSRCCNAAMNAPMSR
jgi:hypothetical protein